MCDCSKNDDDNLGRDIERAWLIRGEYDKVFRGRAIGGLICFGLFVGLSLLCWFCEVTGMELTAGGLFAFMVASTVVVLIVVFSVFKS